MARREERSLEELEKGLKPLMEGVHQTSCKSCWRHLEEGASDVVVIQHRGQAKCLRFLNLLEDGEDVCRSCAEELARVNGIGSDERPGRDQP